MNIFKICMLAVFLPILVVAQDKEEKKLSNIKSDTSIVDSKKNNVNINVNKNQNQNTDLKKNKKTETPNKLKNQPTKEIKEIKNTGNFKKNTNISKKKIGKTSR